MRMSEVGCDGGGDTMRVGKGKCVGLPIYHGTLAARRMELGYGKLSLISDPGRSLVMLLVALSLDRESGLEFGVVVHIPQLPASKCHIFFTFHFKKYSHFISRVFLCSVPCMSQQSRTTKSQASPEVNNKLFVGPKPEKHLDSC
jgi:hypothetical protein